MWWMTAYSPGTTFQRYNLSKIFNWTHRLLLHWSLQQIRFNLSWWCLSCRTEQSYTSWDWGFKSLLFHAHSNFYLWLRGNSLRVVLQWMDTSSAVKPNIAAALYFRNWIFIQFRAVTGKNPLSLSELWFELWLNAKHLKSRIIKRTSGFPLCFFNWTLGRVIF